MTDLESLRYPVGRFARVTAPLDRATRSAHIDTIEQMPARFRALVAGKSDAELDTPYRPDAIKAYEESRWAELPEAKSGPADMSLTLLDGLHRRWVMFMRGLTDADCARVYVHPELGRVTIDEAIALYSWHARHHAGHLRLGLGIRD